MRTTMLREVMIVNKCEVTACVRRNANMHGWGCTPGGELEGLNFRSLQVQWSSMFM